MSALALQRIYFAKRKRSTSLDLRECNLTELPKELSELTWLTALNLNDNRNLINLSSLSNLTLLQKLTISDTLISNLSPLSSLTALNYLNISLTQVSNLSPLSHLTALQKLDVNQTQIKDLTPLSNLTTLQELWINSTQVKDLTPLSNLTALQKLNIQKTKISDLSPLKGYKKLEELNISITSISDLSPLKEIKTLKQFHGYLSHVINIDVFKDFENLEIIDIAETKVKDLLPFKKIIERGLPVKSELELFKRIKGIYVKGCPLTNPPEEIVQQGNKAILRYWSEQERVGKKKVNEARLLLVGQGASGKTTLKDKLKDYQAAMPKPDATTIGIDIERLQCKNQEGEDFTVQVWDFGGQNIQKYAHQFFMSDSVVYAVLSNTREQNPNFQYWLNIIELLGKESPFFIVQNEKDGHLESLKDITQIQERFPHTFKSVEQVNLKNAATDLRFEALKIKLFDAATKLPHTQKEYLVSFINVRKQLEILSKTKQTIPFSEFRALCRAEGIEDIELMNDYARTFTLLGIALHFGDDVHLKTQIFLRPKWIIDALFAVLYAEIVEQQNGKFSASDAEIIWQDKEYEDMHGVLLQLMVKFHLCYEIPNTKDYIVPQRLQTRNEPFVPPTDATHIIYRYRFLPSGILTQLTCRLHQRIKDDKAWNDAVQFSTKNEQGHVFVRENSTDNQLELFGYGAQKEELINLVIETIDEIHSTSKFGNLKVEKLVPCPCAVCVKKRANQEEGDFFEYELLIKDLQNGEMESDRCKLSRQRFPIKKILKNASIRLFKMEQIKELLEDDNVEDALNILKKVFPKEDEIILQLSRLSNLNYKDRTGQLTFDEANKERNRIIDAVLEMLKAREDDL